MMKISQTVTELWHIQECLEKNDQRGMTRHPDLIHILIKPQVLYRFLVSEVFMSIWAQHRYFFGDTREGSFQQQVVNNLDCLKNQMFCSDKKIMN